jgi:hexosaminidase
MKKIPAFFFLFSFLIAFAQSQKPLPLIPYPNEVILKTGEFNINSQTVIYALEIADQEALWLRDLILKYAGTELIITSVKPKNNFIELLLKPGYNKAAYELKANSKSISIFASDNSGIFYGIQTFWQIISREEANSLFPALNIKDEPAYSWRGMHLDCSRHFFSPEEIKKYIDYLAMYKMNVFHWHLTDDQGWRIEIKKYPKLTEISSKRKETLIGRPSKDQQFDGKEYGGFYTQEELKEIVKYAEQKHITIVPEIEMPGHSLAVLAAYPELSCKGESFETGTWWGVFDDVFCAGNDSVFVFLQNVLEEVISIFPSKFIHIGGDECPKIRWETCEKCQLRIKTENLKDEHELQSYFIRRIEKFLNSKGRQIIGWDEILEGGLAPNAAVMSWRGTSGGIAAAKENHFVVMSPGNPCYFDHYQSSDKSNEPLAIGGYNPLDSVYAYNPVPSELNNEEAKFVLGAQGNVWTEYMKTFDHVEYMAMPRMAALAEALWTYPQNKDITHFKARLKEHTTLLNKLKVNYCKHFMNK